MFGLHGVINFFEPIYTNQKIFLKNWKLWHCWTHIPTDNDLVGLSDGCLFGWRGPVPIEPGPHPSLLSPQGLPPPFLPASHRPVFYTALQSKAGSRGLRKAATEELQKVCCFQLYWKALGLVPCPLHPPQNLPSWALAQNL